MPTTRSGRATGRVSPTASITSPEFAVRQEDLDKPVFEDTSDSSFVSPMADQRQANNVQGGAGRQGDEAEGEQINTNNVQMVEMMRSMMMEMQRQQEEMATFRQQIMQVPAFKAIFPGSSQQQVETNESNKSQQNVPLVTEAQQTPVINLEPQNSGEGPQRMAEVSPTQQPIVPINPVSFTPVQIPTIPTHSQQLNQQQILRDASVHQQISVPPTPQMNQYGVTSQKAPVSSQYVTKEDMMDVINQLRKQTTRPTGLDFTPPYPAHVRRQPYPAGYIEHPPQFPKYNGEKGNAREHIARFVESMSPWLGLDEVSNHNILLREFNKTLTDGAFSWYYNLEKGSIQDWDDMKLQFFKKFFYVQKQVTIVELMRIQQKSNEELSNYVDRFRTQAQKCVEPIEEKNLVSICNNGALDTFKPHLITKACDSFSTLSIFAQDLGGIVAIPVNHPTATWKGKRTATVALADSQQKPQGGKKERAEKNDRREGKPWDYSKLPVPGPITCSEKAFRNLYEQWIEHGVIKPLRSKVVVTEEMKKRPDFCVFHQYTGHSTMNCYSLRRIYHEKLEAGEIELGQGNSVHDKPLPNHKGKETCNTIIHNGASETRESEMTENRDAPKEVEEVPEPGLQVTTLMNGIKFRSFFDQIGLTKEARIEATKAIIKVAETQEVCMAANKSFVKMVEQEENKISFSKADREVKYPHNRPLYVTAVINGMEVRRAFIDNGASVNIMPYNVFKQLGLSEKKLIKEKTSITGFANQCTRTLGHVRVDMQVGKVRGPVTFHVAEIDAAYHVLLGRAWQNDYGVVPSVFHQCIKAIWKGKEVRVPATKNPFAPEEAHIIEATFFDDVAEEGENDITKPDSLKLASWEEVQVGKFVPEKKEKTKKPVVEQGESSKGKQPIVVDLEKELAPGDARNMINAKRAEDENQKLTGTKRKDEKNTNWKRVVKPNGKMVFRL